mgnify:CR=1 FL=1
MCNKITLIIVNSISALLNKVSGGFELPLFLGGGRSLKDKGEVQGMRLGPPHSPPSLTIAGKCHKTEGYFFEGKIYYR